MTVKSLKQTMEVGGPNRRWHAVTCAKANPPPWRDWEEHGPKQGGLGAGFLWVVVFLVWFWVVFFLVECVCIVSLTYYLAFMNMQQ